MDLLDGAHALGIDVDHDATSTVASLRGDLDVATTPRLRSVIAGLVEAGHTHVVLDLNALTFCDSTGLSALVALHHRFEEADGRLDIRQASPMVTRILELTALDRTLHIVA